MNDEITRRLTQQALGQSLMNGAFDKLAIMPDELVTHVEKLVNGEQSIVVLRAGDPPHFLNSIYAVTEALGVEVIEVNRAIRGLNELNSVFKDAKSIDAVIVMFHVETLSETARSLLTV